MAFCTQCGAVFVDSDMAKHKCKTEDIPAKGTERRPQCTVSPVDTP